MKSELHHIPYFSSFLRFPSISVDPARKKDVNACANWLCHHLKSIGLQTVQKFATPLHPIIYAEHISHPSYQTILFYGHYDVQPVTPLAEWDTAPFEPVIKDNYIYARGASDDKGQLFIHVTAIAELLNRKEPLTVNIKCLFEGEEEIGSPHLAAFIRDNREKLRCEVAVVSDTKMLSAGQPALTYSLRGSLNAILTIRRQGTEAHSGTFGGMIQNPAEIAASLVAAIRNSDGCIAVPGFYDEVLTVSAAERECMRQTGPSDAVLLREAGIQKSWGEKGYTHYERTTIRPSLTVTTLSCGYAGEGMQNVVPAEAVIKMNLRLVPRQMPGDIGRKLSAFVKNCLPPGFTYTLQWSAAVKPVKVSKHNSYIQAAAAAYETAFAKAPVFLRSGGTIPVVSLFKEILQVPAVLMGFALATDNMHAPNEKFYLPNFARGVRTSLQFIQNVSRASQHTPAYATLHH